MLFGQNIANGVTKISDPVSSAVAVADLRELLRLESDGSGADSDTYLEGLLLSATQFAQQYLRRAISGTSVVRQYDQPMRIPELRPESSRERYLLLPYPPLVTVDRVYTITADGTETAVTDYNLDTVSEPARLLLHNFTTGRDIAYLRVEYTAGYTTVPRLLQQGILQHAAYMYEHRGDCAADDAARLSGATALYGGYRVGVT